jgi:hypothetical protein
MSIFIIVLMNVDRKKVLERIIFYDGVSNYNG